ncbi:SRPBCC family protein [Promicromonospora soli]
MNDKDLSITFTVDEDPDQVFEAINDVRSWWSGDIDGVTDKLGSRFTYTYEDMHQSTQEITDLVPGELVAWRVVEGRIRFVEDETEWTDTVLRFDIAPRGAMTEVRFTHVGLVPESECFDRCSTAWQHYIATSLRDRVTGRTGDPR